MITVVVEREQHDVTVMGKNAAVIIENNTAAATEADEQPAVS
ncbi:MAG: hypothetical protein N2C14_24365 [Planctomycetales bacterium]